MVNVGKYTSPMDPMGNDPPVVEISSHTGPQVSPIPSLRYLEDDRVKGLKFPDLTPTPMENYQQQVSAGEKGQSFCEGKCYWYPTWTINFQG